MQAKAVMEHLIDIGGWLADVGSELPKVYPVDPAWPGTAEQPVSDSFIFGDPEVEVTGIAVAWMATNQIITEAAQAGLNLFICHEPAFYQGPGYAGTDIANHMTEQKCKLLREQGITLLRCHDVCDRIPDIGIVDTWAGMFGFETESRPVGSYYKICLVNGLTVEALARRILERVRPYGQETVLIWGDRDKRVERLAVGTGAVTHLPPMLELAADAALVTDDGFRLYAAQLAFDLDMPALVVHHSTAEKPGMKVMTDHLSEQYPQIPVRYLPGEFPYSSMT